MRDLITLSKAKRVPSVELIKAVMEFHIANYSCFGIWLLLFSATLLPPSDARKMMLHPKRLSIRKQLQIDDASIMDSSNAQPYVSSPFSWPPFDSLSPENSPPYCILPPSTPLPPPSPPSPSTSPGPSGPIPTPIGPSPITPILPSPITPSLPVPSPPETGFIPSPPETGFNPSPPYFEPSPPGNPPSTPSYVPSPPSIFVPGPPIFEPPVVYPPPLGPPPRTGAVGALWCVVKPSVPDPIIQEAMNYACASGADCGPIQPNGPCYTPDNLFAHASFAFNSYWQRTKVAGGTCSFGGTAILVTVDPSHEGCHFDYF